MFFTPKFLVLLAIIALTHISLSASNLQVVFNDKQYYLDTSQKVNWYRAAQLCAARNMRLISIESDEEYNNLRKYLFENDIFESFWLSGNDLSARGTYNWLETGKNFTYTQWAASQPKSSTSIRCVQTDLTFRWVVASCTGVSYYMCSSPTLPDCGVMGGCSRTSSS